MNKKRTLWLLAATLVASAGGCAYGGDPAGEEPAEESAQVEFHLASRVTPAPGATVTDRTTAGEAEEDPVYEEDPAQQASRPVADCIDLSSGAPRLVPCTVRQVVRTAPVGHDDPDPWRPVGTPVTPSY